MFQPLNLNQPHGSGASAFDPRVSIAGLPVTLTLITLVAVLLSTVFAAPPASASVDIDLFTVTIAVGSNSSEARKQASRTAMNTLLVRVTGDARASDNYPLLGSSLARASDYVVSYSYEHIKPIAQPALVNNHADELGPPSGAVAPEQLQLKLVFQSMAIKRLLSDAGAPFWQADRPGVLVWLADQSYSPSYGQGYDENQVQRLLVNTETAPARFAGLQAAAQRRGIPLIEPLLDLDEMRRITVDDIWQMDYLKIQSASERYDSPAVLIGRLSQATDQSWVGQWSLLYRGQRQTELFRGQTLSDFFDLGANIAADSMASDYTVRAGQQQMGSTMYLSVSGVRSQRDYVAVVEYLRKITALNSIRLDTVENERCHFTVVTGASREKLRALIELNKRFELQGGLADSLQGNRFATVGLHYALGAELRD